MSVRAASLESKKDIAIVATVAEVETRLGYALFEKDASNVKYNEARIRAKSVEKALQKAINGEDERIKATNEHV